MVNKGGIHEELMIMRLVDFSGDPSTNCFKTFDLSRSSKEL